MKTRKEKARRAERATPNGVRQNFVSVSILHPDARDVKSHNVPIYVRGRVVGHVTGDTFYKHLQASRHFLKRPPAIAFDVITLKDAQQAGATKVEITDVESGRVYLARIDDILRDGKRFNRGYGWQVYYLLSRWRNPDAPEQMMLFDIPQVGETRDRLAAGAGLSQGTSPLSKRKEVAR